jgi:hypothetical protein
MDADDGLAQAARAYVRGALHQRARQRQVRAAEEVRAAGRPAQDRPLGNLAYALLQMWAWGSLSAAKLQKLAAEAVADACPEPSLQRLAQLGGRGAHPGNCQRDLLEFLQRVGMAEPPRAVAQPVPLQLRQRAAAELVDLPYLPLHRIFAHLHTHWPSEWRLAVTGQAGAAGQWWRALDKEGDPRWQAWRRDLLGRALASGQTLAEMLEATVPLALHADGVQVFRRKSLMVLSAVSMLGRGSTKDLKFLMHSYWTQLQAKGTTVADDTEEAVWEAVKWDLEACAEGVHPAHDHKGRAWAEGSEEARLAGTPWGGGVRAIPWICRGDLDQYAKAWKLEHYGSNQPCPWCRANRSTMPWTDFRQSAEWKSHCWRDDAEWRAAHPHRHPMFNCLQMGIHSAVVDGPLHTMALGVAQHVAGNVVFQLVYQAVPDALGNTAEKLAHVWAEVQGQYTERHASGRLGRLDMQMFCNARAPYAHYPELQSKAKEAEHFCLALAEVWETYADHTDPVHISISEVMRSLCFLFNVCRADGYQLCESDKRHIMHHADNLLLHYTALANKSAQQAEWRWNIVPKMHMLWHWSRQCQYIHPRDTGTYMDEDFVGIVKEICRASTGGMAIPRLPGTVMRKYAQGCLLRWHKRAREAV